MILKKFEFYIIELFSNWGLSWRPTFFVNSTADIYLAKQLPKIVQPHACFSFFR